MNNTLENILDVTLLEPRAKHPTIFIRFDELNKGEDLTIHNDHDPKPLYYQLLGERGNVFTWEYLQEGPEWWIVKITKRADGEMDETMGEIATKDLQKAQIFKKYGLDFCCGGKKTVKQACEDKGIDVTIIEQELQQADKIQASRPLPYNDWELDFLSDYIVNTHHSYVNKNLPDIRDYANKVMRVHGDKHPELVQVRELVEKIHAELTAHMEKEEQILFPFIKKLVAAKTSGNALNNINSGSVSSPITVMEMEHEEVGKHLEEIRTLTQNYTLPQDACSSYSMLYRLLDEFEDDIHLHIHLENNILFPKALDLEKRLLNLEN